MPSSWEISPLLEEQTLSYNLFAVWHRESEHVDPLFLCCSIVACLELHGTIRNTRASSSLQIWSLMVSGTIYITSLEREKVIFRRKLLCSHGSCCAPNEIPWQESTCSDNNYKNCSSGVTILVATSYQKHGMILPPPKEQLIKGRT